MNRLIAACGLFLLLCGSAAAQPAMIVLDASASMWGRIEDRAKIAILREVLAGQMSRWPAQRPVGLMAYGHRHARDCADIELLSPPVRDRAALTAAAARLTPRGRTPMAEAVRQAAALFGPGGGSVILVSDGIETCHPDPCAVAQALARSDPRLVVHTIGFGVTDPAALAQLRCMAEATGGRAFAARNAADLADALDRAAALPTPASRAAAPRPEPVPPPRLAVTLRLCPGCDPMTGDATIILRRGEEQVAVNGEPFGRFFDLPPGAYSLQVTTALFERPAVPVTVPAAGVGRAEIILDAGWLVGDLRSDPSGHEVPAHLGAEWSLAAGGAAPAEAPAFLLPAGRHLLQARLGTATGSAEAQVTAGEVTVQPVGIRFGMLTVAGEEHGPEPVTVTALGQGGEWQTLPGRRLALAPGRYRIEGAWRSTEVEIASESETVFVAGPGD